MKNQIEYKLERVKAEDKKIERLIQENNLGNEIKSIKKVTGGLSHRMYKVETDKGIYAVKELNSGVMKREKAYSNFVFSEKVTDIAKENGILAIGAIKLNDEIMVKIEESYFMVFEWIEGKILKAEEITDKHCEIIGKTLAQIHNIDFSKIEDDERKSIETNLFDWNKYITPAEEQNKPYIKELKENIELLYELNKNSVEALEYAKNNLVISHTDLDRKNVMWQDDKPFIIDWEASGYINPTIELIQVAWYWSGGDIENIDYNKFEKVIESYKQYYKGNIDKNIDILINADVYGGLAWLDYNLKRSLCIENKYDNEEIQLAENEVIQSLKEIKYNISQFDKMIEIMKK